MAGKAPSRRKDKTHNSRPYDRPNQGIFGKVASKVKDLLIPSWFSSVPNWIRTEEVDGSTPTTQIDEIDLTENEEESRQVKSTSKPRLPIRPAKRLRYDNNVSYATREGSPSLLWSGPSTSRERTVMEIEDGEITPIIPNCDIRKKDPQVIVNGDDHSENSDNSASTSGCSSLISSQEKPHRSNSLKLSESALKHLRGELKRKSTFSSSRQDVTLPTDMFSSSIPRLSESRTTLWSCGTQTPVKSFPQRPSPSNRPSFNVSSFGRTTPMINASNLKISSPFYEGNTTYGGASAYRKKPLAPYQINSAKSLRNQVKVKENNSNEGIECMSSAARRILHTLERMSTPISDAKRIPNLTQSPLDISTIALPSHRLKSYLSIPTTSTASPKGPPIVNLNAVSKVPLLKNHNSRITRNSMMEIPIQPCSPSILEDCLTKPVKDAQNESLHQSPAGGGGKMKMKRHSLHPSRSKDVEESTPDYTLPNVPFKIRNMPVFKMGSPVSESNSAKRKLKQPESEELRFTFSSPIEYPMPPTTSQSPKVTVTSSFEFSPPLVVTPEAKPIQKTATEQKKNADLILSGSVNDILKNMRDSKKSVNSTKERGKLTAKDDDITSIDNNAVTTTAVEDEQISSGFGDKFKPKPGSWTCSTCLVQNVGGVKCVACETPKQTATAAKSVDNFSTTSLKQTSGENSLNVTHEPGSWTCGTCLVRNKTFAVKCIACETPKPSTHITFGTGNGSFGVTHEAGSWACGTCLVRNKSCAVKCIACETPKPISTTQITFKTGFGDNFKPQAGTWECPTCMVRNAASSKKCAACETVNPSEKDKPLGKNGQKGSDSKMHSISSVDSNFLQNTADTWECDTCLVRNALCSTKCVACETLKPSTRTASTNANAGFKFGASIQNSSPFTFGSLVSTSVPTLVAPNFKFGVSANTSKPTTNVSETGLKFGVSVETSKITVSESGFKFGIPLQTTEASIKPTLIFGSQDLDKAISSSSSAKSEPAKDLIRSAEKFKLGVQPIPTTTSKETITFPSTSGLFSVNNPMVFTNSSDDSNEKIKVSDSAATGFKFGTTPLGKSDLTKGKPEDGKQTLPLTFVTPASIFGNNTPATFHSTADTEKQQTLSKGSVSTIGNEPPAVLSTLKPIAPFTFGVPTTTIASSVSLGGNSNVSTFGQFGENTSKSREPSPFKMIEKNPAISAPLSQNIKTIASSGIAPFSFTPPTLNALAAPASQAETKSISSNDTSLQTVVSTIASSMPVFTNFVSTPSTFVFGCQNPTAPTTTSTFAFGAPAQVTPSSLVSVPSTNTINFAFNATSTNENKTGFAFKPNEEKKPSLFASPSLPTYGNVNPPALSTPFKFGAKTTQPATGSFGFSAPKQDVASTQGIFAFGGEKAKQSFSAFPPSQPTTTVSTMPSFNFGSNPPNSSSAFKPATTTFSFGAKTAPSAPAPNPLNPPANPPSVFGSPAVQLPVFGANTSSPAFGSTVAPAFGNISDVPKLQEPVGGFNFSAASVPAATSTPFMFGASAEKKPAMGTAQTPGFNFMSVQPPQSDAPSSNFSGGFNMNTPQNFNFGATSTLTNQPFQFAAVGEGNNNPNAAVIATRRFRRAVRRGMRKD